jgi:hypothetical protein
MRFLLSLFLFFATVEVNAQTTATAIVKENVIVADSSKVNQRSFNAQKLKAYSEDSSFIYDDSPPLDTSWWTRFWKWFWSLFDHLSLSKGTGTFLKSLVIVAIGAAVIYIVMKLIGGELNIFARKAKAVDVPYQEYEDNIHEINFAEQIEKAIAQANYRLAVRLLYLQSLKKLSDRELIHWMPEKTNQTYISEIEDADRKAQFSALTRQFEYIWYGEFFIGKEGYAQVRNTFDNFNLKVS